jgi:hypothetical protein
MHGGLGQGQFGLGHPAQTHPSQVWGQQSWGPQFGTPQFQAAFGGPMTGQQAFGQQRQLTQQDVADVTRQLIGLIPQVIGNLQAYGQQRVI